MKSKIRNNDLDGRKNISNIFSLQMQLHIFNMYHETIGHVNSKENI